MAVRGLGCPVRFVLTLGLEEAAEGELPYRLSWDGRFGGKNLLLP